MSSDPTTAGRPRIAVLRALPGLGDLLCAVPALRAIRAAHPAAHVTLLGLPSAGWFVQSYPWLVDDLLAVTTAAACPSRGEEIDLPVRDGEAAARGLLDEAGLAGGLDVCVHPGASRPERRWPPARIGAAARDTALRRFSLAGFTRAWEDLFASVASGGSAASTASDPA